LDNNFPIVLVGLLVSGREGRGGDLYDNYPIEPTVCTPTTRHSTTSVLLAYSYAAALLCYALLCSVQCGCTPTT
jgi:hypothetical protein